MLSACRESVLVRRMQQGRRKAGLEPGGPPVSLVNNQVSRLSVLNRDTGEGAEKTKAKPPKGSYGTAGTVRCPL